MERSIGIYQIFYDPRQKDGIDRSFVPLDNTENLRPEWREYWVFRKMRQNPEFKKYGLRGIFSWKFEQKTGVPGAAAVEFIKSHPGYDLYFINPFPLDLVSFRNVWLQGNHYHEDFLELAGELFENAGIKWDPGTSVDTRDTAGFCNFWVATDEVWEEFFSLGEKIFSYIEANPQNPLVKRLMRPADSKIPSGYLPFVMERLISIVVHQNPQLKSIGWVAPVAVLDAKYPGLGRPIKDLLALRDRLRASLESVDSASVAARRLVRRQKWKNFVLNPLRRLLKRN